MLERAVRRGLALPEDWRMRYPVDPAAPSSGSWRGWGKFFVLRSRRVVGRDPSESLHPTATAVSRGWTALGALVARWQAG